MIFGLSYMHSKKILHRDIKPQNILITKDLNIKIADLGLGREYLLPIKDLSNDEIVTLWYRSPEIILGIKNYSTKIDVWSLGCVIAEMARNGNILFHGLCEWEVLMAILQFLGSPSKNDQWIKQLKYFSMSFPKFSPMKFENGMGKLKDNKNACHLLKVELFLLY